MKNNKEDYLERLERLRPIDDIFMRAMFRDNRSLGEFVLRIIMERPDLKLTKFSVQADMKHVTGARSVVFDVLAEDSNGEVLSMEVQRETKGAEPYRARYNSSNIDIGKLKEGQKFEELPVKWVIFITEKDFFKDGAPIHHIRNADKDTGMVFNDGAHILYVNGEYRGDDPLGRLMHDFNCADPEEMYNPEFRERARYLKKTEGGASTMCKEMEELAAAAFDEGMAKKGTEMVINMLKAGDVTTERMAAYSGLTVEEIEEIRKNM